MMNLDDEQERKAFIAAHGTTKGRALANKLGLSGHGSAVTATALSNYAWNAETALRCRLRDDEINAALFKGIADRIYNERLRSLGWW